jgi:integrase
MLGQELIVAATEGPPPPALIEGSGRKARDRIEHFLRAAIDNDNTRKAYGRSLGSFFAFLEEGGRARIQDIGPLDVRDYLEAAKANGLSTATLKQHMAAIRMLLDHLVTGGVLEHNPALSVKAPRQKLGKGKTPVLTAEEAGDLLRSIETATIVGLRDRALIGVMVFTFARVSAACGINVADLFHQQRRLWVRLHEKRRAASSTRCPAITRWRPTSTNTLSVPNSRTPEGSPSSRPSGLALMVVGRRSSMVSGSTETMLGLWCAVAPRQPASQHKYATTPSAAQGSRPTSRTAAHSRRPARWRRMPRREPHSSTTAARTASRWMKW